MTARIRLKSRQSSEEVHPIVLSFKLLFSHKMFSASCFPLVGHISSCVGTLGIGKVRIYRLAASLNPVTRWDDRRSANERIVMSDQLPVFEPLVKKRGRVWRWCLCTAEGHVVMRGTESSRPAAKYRADRALFLMLLCAPYRATRPKDRDVTGYNRSSRSHSTS